MPALSYPVVYAFTAGLASAQAIGANSTRRRIMLGNPNITTGAQISVCPATDNQGNPVAAVLQGAGSFPIVPGAWLDITDPRVSCAWNVISNVANTPFTIWEFGGNAQS